MWAVPKSVEEFLVADVDVLARRLTCGLMFTKYFERGRGVLLEPDDDGLVNIQPVDRWNDAFEAERRQ